MSHQDGLDRKSTGCDSGQNCTSFHGDQHHHSRVAASPTQPSHLQPHLFPTVDVPEHAHDIIGSVILLVGLTGMLGNALVVYVFCRSRSLRSPSNLLVVNLAAADFLMSLSQSPVFFVASLHRRWVFGEVACELYAFCGALFGIASMMTLTAIAADRCFAITRPLVPLGGLSRGRVLAVLAGVWIYSLGWSLPPFFGWSAYVPEGLQTSCSWDYMSFTATVRAYTILLFAFVFFVPLGLITGCYVAIFREVRRAGREVERLSCVDTKKAYERLRTEWRLAKVTLGVILLFVISWSPYSVVALTATAGYAHLLTPYMNSVPAVIAKASAIHNPIIYAITHPKYRAAIGRHIPLLRPLLRLQEKDLHSSLSSSGMAVRRATPTNLSAIQQTARGRLSSSATDDSCWVEKEADSGQDVPAENASTALLCLHQGPVAPMVNPAAGLNLPEGGAAAEATSQLPL